MARFAVIILLLLIGGAIDAALNSEQWKAGYAQAQLDGAVRKCKTELP